MAFNRNSVRTPYQLVVFFARTVSDYIDLDVGSSKDPAAVERLALLLWKWVRLVGFPTLLYQYDHQAYAR